MPAVRNQGSRSRRRVASLARSPSPTCSSSPSLSSPKRRQDPDSGFEEKNTKVPSQDFGLPSRQTYFEVEQSYMSSLHKKKKEKALLTQEMFDNIWDVLHEPTSVTILTPQFRYWVRKMFALSDATPEDAHRQHDDAYIDPKVAKPVVLHNGVPVAVKSQIYDILCFCHNVTNHGGRDRTTAEVHRHYSWIPKELIARFVKVCPTCKFSKIRKSGHETPVSENHSKVLHDSQIPYSSPRRSTKALRVSTSNQPDDGPPEPELSKQPSRSGVTLPSIRTLFATPHFDSPATSNFGDSGWLNSLAKGPGPTASTSASSYPLRRVESANDSYYPTVTPFKLPSLAKGYSDGTLYHATPMYGPSSSFTSQYQSARYHKYPQDTNISYERYDSSAAPLSVPSTSAVRHSATMIDPVLLQEERHQVPITLGVPSANERNSYPAVKCEAGCPLDPLPRPIIASTSAERLSYLRKPYLEPVPNSSILYQISNDDQ